MTQMLRPPTGWTKPELSDPPEYSADRQFIKSKDGLSWSRVAPDAAAAPGIGNVSSGIANATGFVNVAQNAVFSGAAPAPGPFQTITIKPEPILPVPPHVQRAVQLFTKVNLTREEQKMRDDISAIILRHEELIKSKLERERS